MRPVSMVSTVRTAAVLAVFAGMSLAGVKNIAVVETEIDARSGAAAEIAPAEVGEITAELRRAAINNLPRNKYNVMTSETVYAQGSAVLAECADENCVITLGNKIGADYIVRGIIRKFQTLLTLTVEIYETEDGNLVASSDPIRSKNAEELLEKTTATCAKMYKTFAETQNATPIATIPTAPTPATYTVTVNISPAKGGYVYPNNHKTEVKAGDELTLTAMAYQGYTFAGWLGAATTAADTTNLLKITVDGDMEVVANFIRETKKNAKAKDAAMIYEPAPEEKSVFFSTTTGEFGSMAKPAAAAKLKEKSKKKKSDWYFAPKYQVPGPMRTPEYGAANVEFGRVRGQGMFWGIDLGGGRYSIGTAEPFNFLGGVGSSIGLGGFGFNVGNVYDLTEDLQLVYGMSAGARNTSRDRLNDSDEHVITFGIGGPFIRLRWRFLELAYRGLFGFEQVYGPYVMIEKDEYIDGMYGHRYYSAFRYYETNISYDHQLMLGLYFATQKRTKTGNTRNYDLYFASRYQIPGSYLTPKNGAANFEFGHVRGKGNFVGLVLDVGNSESAETMIGGGVNFGSVYNLPVDLQLVYGWAVGFWYMGKSYYIYGQNPIGQRVDGQRVEEAVTIGGPIAGLRWRYLELLYRGQLGGGHDFGYHNQLSIGLYLATNSRTKPH